MFIPLLLASWVGAAPTDIQLIAPTQDSRWAADSIHWVRWQAKDIPPTAMIQIDISKNGNDWDRVATVPNSGSYRWKVRAGYQHLRLQSMNDGKVVRTDQSFHVIPSQEVLDYQWQAVNLAAPFASRDGAGALTYRGKLWLIGGWNPGDKRNFPRICSNDVWSSENGKDWKQERVNTFIDRNFPSETDWEGRHTAGYVVHRDRMWIVGGDVNQGHYHFDVWNCADGKKWSHVNRGKPVPWGPRALHYTVAFQDAIWVMGGQTVPQFAKAEEIFYHDVWRSEDGIDWQRIEMKKPYTPQRGMIGGSVVFQNQIWLLGGGTYDTAKRPDRNYYADVWSSTDGSTWNEHELAPWEPRQYHDVIVFDGRMWVMEGYAKGNRNDVWYSADGTNWYELTKTPWKPRHAASIYVHDRSLWMIAGNNMESDVWRLNRRTTKE